MKKSILYIATMLLASAGFVACDDDMEKPPIVVPGGVEEPDLAKQANTTILELKQAFNGSDFNYSAQVGTKDNGEHYIIKGRIVSSDEAGNIYKNLMIEDETAGLTIGINQTKLYQSYKPGQMVVIDCTGLYMGGYGNCMQLGGAPQSAEKPQPSRMDEEDWAAHSIAYGIPQALTPHVVTVEDVNAYRQNPTDFLAWQSRLVTFENMHFETPGEPLAVQGSSTSRYALDDQGNRIQLYNSGYSTFWAQLLPAGKGKITGVLSFYNREWQVLLLNYEGLSDFTGGDIPVAPTGEGTGTEADPYNCVKIISMAPSSTSVAVESGVWVKGYIVGYYAEYAAHFDANGSQAANILVADAADVKDESKCVCVQLLSGSDMRTALNLVDNPGNLGKPVAVCGDVMKYNSLPGIKNPTAFKFEGGGNTPSPSEPALFSETFLQSQGAFTIEDILLSDGLSYVWHQDAKYGMVASAFVDGTSYASSSWLISPVLDMAQAQDAVLTFDHVCNKFPSLDDAKRMVSLGVREVGGEWQTVAIPNFSTNADWSFVPSGDISLSAFEGKKIQIGFHYTSENGASGSWEIKNFTIRGNGSIAVGN